jgi:hypothetical protein
MRLPKTLIVLLAVGSAMAAVASAVEPESILASGPAVGVVGLWLAALAYRWRRTATFFYALLGPTVFVACAAMIAVMEWGPLEARAPVAAVLTIWTLFQSATLPWAQFDWRSRGRSHRGQAADPANSASGAIVLQELPPARLQLSLRWLMLLMLLSTAPMVTFTLAGEYASIVAAAVVYVLLVLLSVRAFYRNALPDGQSARHDTSPQRSKGSSGRE